MVRGDKIHRTIKWLYVILCTYTMHTYVYVYIEKENVLDFHSW